MLRIHQRNQKERGFTIVELLVVIVVIGILAAITIVSYTGITARANGSSAQSTANNIMSKSLVFGSEPTTTDWPLHLTDLTGAASTTSYFVAPGSVTLATAAITAATATPKTVNFLLCGTNGTSTAPTTYAGITVTSGVKIGYWDYTTPAIAYLSAGVISGTYLTFPVACFISTT